MSKSEIRRLDITDPIETEAGLKLFTEMNNHFGSSVWGPVRIGIIAIESEIRQQIAREIEDLIDPPPIDEIDYIVVDVIKRCADIARGVK